ncbi:MAG: phosphoribosylanthranilate isomerase [Pseudomonadota bacterium]
MAIDHGADALGLVGAMPSGPGVIGDREIAAISASIGPPVASFLLTSETGPEAIVDHVRRCGTGVVQLVDRIAPKTYVELRAALPGTKLVQVVHVAGPESVDEAAGVAPLVDAILLDSGRPGAGVKILGGTGRVHDWDVSRRIVETTEVPVFLAGGLRPDNVAEAIRHVRPFGVDLCTGVRTDGRLDPAKLRAFVDAVNGSQAGPPEPRQDDLGRDTVAHR